MEEKVIVAFESEKAISHVREIIETANLASCYVCRSAAEVKRLVHKQHLSAVVCGYKFSDDTAECLFEDLPPNCSMLVVAPQSVLSLIENEDIFCLPAPASRGDLLTSVRMLLQVGHRIEKFIRPRRSQQEKGILEEAKAILMERNGLSEAQAHRLLQKKSMDSGTRLIQTAQMVVDGNWVL